MCFVRWQFNDSIVFLIVRVLEVVFFSFSSSCVCLEPLSFYYFYFFASLFKRWLCVGLSVNLFRKLRFTAGLEWSRELSLTSEWQGLNCPYITNLCCVVSYVCFFLVRTFAARLCPTGCCQKYPVFRLFNNTIITRVPLETITLKI